MILADTVEQPRNGLLNAVINNLRNGVNYVFIVSAENAKSEVDGYYAVFEGLAKAARQKCNIQKNVTDLVNILQLGENWHNVPYVFYRYKDRTDRSQVRTIAFRGDTEGAGIADRYIAVDADTAEALFTLLMGAPPAEIRQLAGC